MKHIHLWEFPFMEVFFFMTNFDNEIVRFMLDCVAKGLDECKGLVSYLSFLVSMS